MLKQIFVCTSLAIPLMTIPFERVNANPSDAIRTGTDQIDRNQRKIQVAENRHLRALQSDVYSSVQQQSSDYQRGLVTETGAALATGQGGRVIENILTLGVSIMSTKDVREALDQE